jgi:lipopolysaccharide export system protein LptC
MTKTITTWFPIALLITLAALTFWLDRQIQPDENAANGNLRHDPDYIVEKFHVIRTGANGITRYNLSADSMTHYPDDDTTHLVAPKLVNSANPKFTVTVTSRNAMLSSDGEDAYLKDDVRLVRSAYDNKGEMVVESSYLHVIPDKNIAQTDAPVRIADTHTVITSVGLEFNSESRVLKLLSHVRSTIEKQKPTR